MHRAGEKIRAWRESQRPPLTAEEFGKRFGKPEPWPSRTVYGWETRGKIPRAGIQRRLAELGICEPADWLDPPLQAVALAADPHAHPFYDMHRHGFVRVATSTPRVRTATAKISARTVPARTPAGAATIVPNPCLTCRIAVT